MSNLNAKEYQHFEQIKHTDENGVEFWFARELAPVLEYAQWRNFDKVIDCSMKIRFYADLFSHIAGVTPKGSNLHNRRQAQRSLRKRTPPAFRLKDGTIPPANVSGSDFRLMELHGGKNAGVSLPEVSVVPPFRRNAGGFVSAGKRSAACGYEDSTPSGSRLRRMKTNLQILKTTR